MDGLASQAGRASSILVARSTHESAGEEDLGQENAGVAPFRRETDVPGRARNTGAGWTGHGRLTG